MTKLVFIEHPLPWTYQHNYAYGENGDDIHVILDANNEVVASSHNSTFDILWQFYCLLTPEQEIVLGSQANNALSANEIFEQYTSLDKNSKEADRFRKMYSENKEFNDLMEFMRD